ncbi:MAG: peptide-methionine (R)-S-oxide reductase MsrB [Vulcanimicrobiaceae bacterium]
MSHQLITRRALIGGGAAALGALAYRALIPAGAAQPSASYQVTHTDAEWQKLLGPDRYAILREGGTERAFSSPLNNEHRGGMYACAGCNLWLFSSTTKYDAGEGWPSFYRPLPNVLRTHTDYEIGYARTEVHCRRCGGHLGHVFDDGPAPTGLRYCIDGLALKFTSGPTQPQ